jgi:1-acyl-sn-glycerol-3-phosphate acyltransferase
LSGFRALWRAAAFLALNLTSVPAYLLLVGFGAPPRRWLIRLWCRATCALLGVTLRLHGTPFTACPTLYVANHVSYIDVVVLGALLDARFIAKAEVARWPLFGQLGALTQTFFVRRRPREALIQRNALAARLRAGHSFVLFAEGTSSDGLAVLPFKTSLLSVAEPWVLDRPVAVQAVTLCYRSWEDGTPIGRDNCDLYAWYGDTELVPHLWRVLGAKGVVIEVGIAAPVLSWAVTGRKQLGAELQGVVAQKLETLRQQDTVAVPTHGATSAQHA